MAEEVDYGVIEAALRGEPVPESPKPKPSPAPALLGADKKGDGYIKPFDIPELNTLKAFGGADPEPVRKMYAQADTYDRARQSYAGMEDDPTLALLANAVPFASAVEQLGGITGLHDAIGYKGSAYHRQAAADAREGKATPEQLDFLALKDRRAEIQAKRSTGKSILAGLSHVPAILGEAAVGGAAVKGLGLAAQAGTAAGTTIGSQVVNYGLRMGVQTAAMPSLYLDKAQELALMRGRRSILEVQSLAPAFALGVIQNSILQGAGKLTEGLGGEATGLMAAAMRIGAGTATGMAAQQAMDLATSGVDDIAKYALGVDTLGIDTKYGLLGELLKGKEGEFLKHATVQAITFAAFTGLHEHAHRQGLLSVKAGREAMQQDVLKRGGTIDQAMSLAEVRDPAVLAKLYETTVQAIESRKVSEGKSAAEAEALQAYKKAVDALAKSGVKPDEAGSQLAGLFHDVAGEMQAHPDMTPAEALERAMEQQTSKPVRELGGTLADIVRQSQDRSWREQQEANRRQPWRPVAEGEAKSWMESKFGKPPEPPATPSPSAPSPPPAPSPAPLPPSPPQNAPVAPGTPAKSKGTKRPTPAPETATAPPGAMPTSDLDAARAALGLTPTVTEVPLDMKTRPKPAEPPATARPQEPVGARPVEAPRPAAPPVEPDQSLAEYLVEQGRRVTKHTGLKPSFIDSLIQKHNLDTVEKWNKFVDGDDSLSSPSVRRYAAARIEQIAEDVRAQLGAAKSQPSSRQNFADLKPDVKLEIELISRHAKHPDLINQEASDIYTELGGEAMRAYLETVSEKIHSPKPTSLQERLAQILATEQEITQAKKEVENAQRAVESVPPPSGGKASVQRRVRKTLRRANADAEVATQTEGAQATEPANPQGATPVEAPARTGDEAPAAQRGQAGGDIVGTTPAPVARPQEPIGAHPEPPIVPHATRVLEGIAQSGVADIHDLRQNAGLSPSQFDALLFALNDAGVVIFHGDVAAESASIAGKQYLREGGKAFTTISASADLLRAVQSGNPAKIKELIHKALTHLNNEAVNEIQRLAKGGESKAALEEVVDTSEQAGRSGDGPASGGATGGGPVSPGEGKDNILFSRGEPRPTARQGQQGPGDRGTNRPDPVVAPQAVPATLFASGNATGGGGGPGVSGSGRVGPHEVIATMEAILGPKTYVDRVPYDPTARGSYNTESRATVINKGSAADPYTNIHERAHDIATQHKLETDPGKLPVDVAEGFRQLDYNPPPQPTPRSTMEGFAEWMVRRVSGQLQNLTPEQQAAADFAEKFLGDAKLTPKMDRLGKLFADMEGRDPIDKAGGLLSPDGKPAQPILTTSEKAASWAKYFHELYHDLWDTPLGVLVRAGNKEAYKVVRYFQFKNQATTGEFIKEGAYGYADGVKVQTGRPFAYVTEPLSDDAKMLRPSGVTVFDVYLAGRRVAELASKGIDVVPPAEQALFAQALAEMAKDPQELARLEEAAKRFTEWNNSLLDALATKDVHRLSVDSVESMKAENEMYASMARVIKDSGWKTNPGSGAGGFLSKIKGGSAEQIASPVYSALNKAKIVAAMLNKQMTDNAFMEFAKTSGAGEYLIPFEEKTTAEGAAEATIHAMQTRTLAQATNMSEAELVSVLKQLGAVDLITHKPWNSDGSRNTWTTFGPDGKPVSYRIGNRALYDLITGQQGDTNSLVMLFRGMGNFPVFRFMNQFVKNAVTTLTMGFQVRNMMRDPYEFLANTIDRSSVGRLPEMYARAGQYYWDLWWRGESSDVLMDRFVKDRGSEAREHAFNPDSPETTLKALGYGKKASPDLVDKVWSGAEVALAWMKKGLEWAGSGEQAPRFLEWLNRMKQLGWTEEGLKTEIEKANAAHKAGQIYHDPIPLADQIEAMHAASEVTVDFSRTGTLVKEINKFVPFFGPAVTGLSKQLRNIKENPAGAATALSVVLGLRLLHWYLHKDEEWYKELSAYDRYNNFVVNIPGVGRRRIPGPRDLNVPLGGLVPLILDAAYDRNPDVSGWVEQSLGAVRPPISGGPIIDTVVGVMRNKDHLGREIVPKREQGLGWRHDLNYQIPYGLKQISGGRSEAISSGVGAAADVMSGGGTTTDRLGQIVQGAGLVPFSQVSNPSRTVNEYYDLLHTLQAERGQALRRGLKYEREKDYQALHAIEPQMKALAEKSRGEKRVNGKVREGERPEYDTLETIRQKKIQLAERALARIRR